MRTYANKPFNLSTNGGDVTIDGRMTTAVDGAKVEGGSIYLYAGTGDGKKLYIQSGDEDYIRFDGFTKGSTKGSTLSISITSKFLVTVKGTSGNSTFSIDENGMKVHLENSLNFSIEGTKNGVTNTFSFDQDKILLSRGEDNKLQMDKDGTLLSSTGAKFDLTAGEDKFYMDRD
jgi:hypothetical protein